MRRSRKVTKFPITRGREAEVPRWRMRRLRRKPALSPSTTRLRNLVIAHLDLGIDPAQQAQNIVLAAIDAAERIIVDLAGHGEDGVVVEEAQEFDMVMARGKNFLDEVMG